MLTTFLVDFSRYEIPKHGADILHTIKIQGDFIMGKGQALQDPFLNALRKERIPVSIFLVNGIKLQGQVESFDQFVVLLRNSVNQMVYKHAISTIVPARNVKLPMSDEVDSSESSAGNN